MNATFKSFVCTVLLLAGLSCERDSERPSPTTRPIAARTRPAPGPVESETRPGSEPLEIVARTVTEGGATVAKLSNGLTVIVKATHQVPVVCVRAYVHTGGLYERPWSGCGISHLTEHLIAKGAVHEMGENTTAGEGRQTSGGVEEIGGQSNAYTSLDHTCYYIAATASRTMDCIDLIADWMARPEISEEDFRREHGVVRRELEMGRDDPDRQMWYAHAANFFRGHPAATPIIGHLEPLSKLTRDDLLEYHRRMYVPQNMIFCVVGEVDTEAVLNRVRAAFAGFAMGRNPDLYSPEVPHVTGVRRVVRAHKELKETTERISFRTIPLIHEDLYALDVLSYVLTEGRSSQLSRKILREKKLVTSVSSNSWTPPWGAGMFTISFRAAPEKADLAEQAIIDELKSIIAGRIKGDELIRPKRQKVADFVNSQQTVESIAATLAGDYLSTGNADFSRHYTQGIQEVTTRDVIRVARKYVDFDAMVVTRLIPGQKEDAAARAKEKSARSHAGKETMFHLRNGLRVVLHPTDAVELVSMALLTRGGLLLEDESTNGLGTLMTSLSTKGAGSRTAEQIAEFFDRAGGSVSGSCGNNTFYWEATVLDDSFDEALSILAHIITRPTFPEKELDILRPVLQTRIKQQDEHWYSELRKWFRRKFFTNSPYRLLPSGSEDVVAAATVKQIAAYHRKCIHPRASVLAVYGNFDGPEARKSIERLFAKLPEGDAEIHIPPARRVTESGERHVLRTEKQVSAIMVAAPGMNISNLEDRFAMDVLDTIISGWYLPSGWLHRELRGKRLVYVVHARNWAGLAPGAFQVYALSVPEKAGEVIEIIHRNLRRASEYKPSQKEIDLAVNSILTAELLRKQSMSSLAMSAGLDELYGFGYDFRRRMEARYRKVTPDDVLRVGRKYLPGGLVTAVTTPKPGALGETARRE